IVKDLDVDGHTNLDNVSIAGVTTTTGNLDVTDGRILIAASSGPQIRINSSAGDSSSTRFILGLATASNAFINGAQSNDACITAPQEVKFGIGNTLKFRITNTYLIPYVDLIPNGNNIRSLGNSNYRWSDLYSVDANISGDLNVDGHTNLDNVSIAGVTTTSDMIKIISNRNALSNPSVAANYHLHLTNPQNDAGETVGIAFGLSTGGDIGAAITHEREGSTSFGNLRFYTKESGSAASMLERMRITKEGKVGINSTSPSHTLDVVGGYQALGLYRNDFTGNSGAGIELNFGRAKANGELFTAARITAVGSDNTAQAAQLRFSVLDSGSMSEKLRITSDGKVGIGSAIPGGVLDLYHATNNTILNVKSGDSGSVINLIDNATRSSIEQNGRTLKIVSDTDGTYANSEIRLQVDGATKVDI
ncbi:MAG: hypothetical protein VXY93_11230, partial [Pseudomonadota bacterium]|nr:hypothetical protein [Pseudomonadota bacterium]